jgi:8-oxo-dGTP pyrophosphatase MutT (NUDIX family)/ribosomal protein S18 acetylase RimI-like enzyme
LDDLGELAWDDFTIGQIVKKAKEKDPTHFSIRKMTDADIKRYELSSKREEIPWNLPHEKLIALGPDNQFAGFAVRNRKSNRLDGLWVQPEFRRQGLGKTLIRSFKKEPSRLNVLKNNSAAQDLYQQLGYSKKFNWRNPEDPAEHWTKVKSAAEKMTGIRYETSQGEGVYEALRKKDPRIHEALLKTRVYNWLRKPEEYPEGAKSYFTARGDHAYRGKTLRIHRGALKHDIQKKVEEINPKDVVYRDEHQMVVKKAERCEDWLIVKEAASNLYRNRVEAFALTPDGKVIAGLYPGKAKNVAVPGGGIEKGETVRRAAKREFKEEAGIAIRNIRAIGVAPVLTAWARKDKSYKGRDWRADIKKHPKGNRTHFVLADVDTAKSKTTPRDPTEFHKTLKARPIEDLIEIQRKAIRTHKNSDRLKQMRKRLEVLLKIKHSEKQAFEIKPNDLMRFMNVLDDKYWMYLLDKHRKEKATLAAQSTYLPPDSTEDKGWDPATLSNRRT